jgi:outer membrane protein OmpA-like peptidoglycan-associated protein
MIDALGNIGRLVAVVAAGVLIAACASEPPVRPAVSARGNVVLLPERDGLSTSVAVLQADRKIVLDQPYAAARVASQAIEAYKSSQQEVEREFGPAIAAQPARASTFTLYFVEGKDEFTDESKRLVEQVLADVARRPVPDVLVVGHTDAVGTDQVNDALGQRRADTVRAALIGRGIAAGDIRSVSRGKRALAVPTADGVAEPRNRRVEIVIR